MACPSLAGMDSNNNMESNNENAEEVKSSSNDCLTAPLPFDPKSRERILRQLCSKRTFLRILKEIVEAIPLSRDEVMKSVVEKAKGNDATKSEICNRMLSGKGLKVGNFVCKCVEDEDGTFWFTREKYSVFLHGEVVKDRNGVQRPVNIADQELKINIKEEEDGEEQERIVEFKILPHDVTVGHDVDELSLSEDTLNLIYYMRDLMPTGRPAKPFYRYRFHELIGGSGGKQRIYDLMKGKGLKVGNYVCFEEMEKPNKAYYYKYPIAEKEQDVEDMFSRTLCFRKMPSNFDKAHLLAIFSLYGAVSHIEFANNKKGVGLVRFESEETIDKIINLKDGEIAASLGYYCCPELFRRKIVGSCP